MPTSREIEVQRSMFEQLRKELGDGATWRELGLALNVNPVRLSQWRLAKGMRLETLIGVLETWNQRAGAADSSQRKCALILAGDSSSVKFSS